MATTKKAKKSVVKSAKKPAASRTAVKKEAAADYAGWDALLPADAEKTNPNIPVEESVFDAERRVKEAKRQVKLLAELPTFDVGTVALLVAAIAELEEAEEVWSKARRRERGKTLEATAAKARDYVSLLVKSGRFLFRRNAKVLAKLDAISEGDGLADLIADLADLLALAKKHGKLFDALKKTAGAEAKLEAFHARLTGGADSVTALQAQARRNKAFWRVQLLSQEVYEALVIVLEDAGVDPKRVVNLRGFETRARQRRASRKKSPAPTE